MQTVARASAPCCISGASTRRSPRPSQHLRRAQCAAQAKGDTDAASSGRREIVLHSVNAAVLGALFTWGGVPRPSGLGVQDYGGGIRQLALCPPSPNCVSTAEEVNSDTHYVPGWAYNAARKKSPATQAQAMAELVEAVTSTSPDGFTPRVIKQTDDYLAVEYESPTFGFIDDFEVLFSSQRPGEVEYRSASRIGESDGDINRKRIRSLRKALEPKGWRSVGF